MSVFSSFSGPRTHSPTAPTERTHLINGDSGHVEAGTQTEVAVHGHHIKNFFEAFSMPRHATAKADAHSHSLMERLKSLQPRHAHVYQPGVSDRLRLRLMVDGAQTAVVLMSLACGFQALWPSRSTIINPSATPNETLAFCCLVALFVGVHDVAPMAAGAVYGTLILGCKATSEKLHAHPLSTRFWGYTTAGAVAAGTLIGAFILHHQATHDTAQIPENGWRATAYDRAPAWALALNTPAFAAIGWYLGRIGSAAVHRSA